MFVHGSQSSLLDQVFVRDGCNEDRLVVACRHKVCGARHCRLPLQADLAPLFGSLFASLLICLDALQKVVSTLAVRDMLDADINTLLHQPISNTLVHNNTHGTRSDIKDDTGTAVVKLVRHATLFGRVGNNVDNVPNVVSRHVCGELDGAMLTELAAEEMASACAIAER